MTFFYALDLLGTMAFAISGSLTAMNKKMDSFGVFIIGFVTAVGGGTLRDVLVGRQPVAWMEHTTYVFVIITAVIFSILFRKLLKKLSKSLFLFDTIGLGIFTIIGTEIGIEANFHPLISIALGTMTGAFGGVIRDILCNEIPVIFRKEIYATACILGAIVFIILERFSIPPAIVYVLTSCIVIITRLIAVKFQLTLPTIYTSK